MMGALPLRSPAARIVLGSCLVSFDSLFLDWKPLPGGGGGDASDGGAWPKVEGMSCERKRKKSFQRRHWQRERTCEEGSQRQDHRPWAAMSHVVTLPKSVYRGREASWILVLPTLKHPQECSVAPSLLPPFSFLAPTVAVSGCLHLAGVARTLSALGWECAPCPACDWCLPGGPPCGCLLFVPSCGYCLAWDLPSQQAPCREVRWSRVMTFCLPGSIGPPPLD